MRALCFALVGIAISTWVALQAGLTFDSTGFLYLVFVVLTAVYGGFWEATIASVVAVACLNYFFVPPLFTFVVSRPEHWVALAAFEFTALVISRLSHQAQVKADEAIRERRDTERLYQTARRILLLDRSREPDAFIPPLICEVFCLPCVVLFDAVSAATHSSGNVPAEAEEQTRKAYYTNSDTFEPNHGASFCALRLGARPVGGLGLCCCNLSPLVATALASLCAIALERKRSWEREFRAEAARETEQLRTAVLDALAHELKTPLATIRTASSGLLAAGTLSDSQAELVRLVDEEASELNSLASRLLQAARLDTVDFKPNRVTLLLSKVVNSAIEALKEKSAAPRCHVTVPRQEAPVMADRKLIITALAQLIDNAIKYSVPESQINIDITVKGAEVVVAVQNEGQMIAPAHRERIFDRFYRAPGTEQRPAGTGLGLSIVRRIAEAHYGRVWTEGDADRGTIFALALPVFRNE